MPTKANTTNPRKLYPKTFTKMRAILDHNHLLCIQGNNLDTGKTYQNTFQGYQISEKNMLLLVLHKKEIKLIELKNIGSTMGILYIAERPPFHELKLLPEFVQLAGEHFEGFDEETGERYYFFPSFSPQRIDATNTMLNKLQIPLQLQPSAKGVISPRTPQKATTEESVEQLLNYFFGLTLLYGKFEAKNGQLNSIKIQIPLASAYLGLQEVLQHHITSLQENGIFLQSSLNTQQGKSTLQISSNDREVLQLFANWYKEIENFEQITKKEQVAQTREQLKAFLQQENIENKAECETLIANGTMKILVK